MTVGVIDREIYTEPEAARLLGLPPSTLHYWLEGGRQGGTEHPPVIRVAPTGRRGVSWAEFIEAGWLQTYRQMKQIPMRELRDFISILRDEFEVPFPLADRRPWVSGKKLVFKAQAEAGLDERWRLVDDQLMLTYPAQTFMERVVWDGDVASGWRPADDPESTVVVRPNIRFGRPAVGGVSTTVIWDESQAGASDEEIAQDFRLSVTDVSWALSYEHRQHAGSRRSA